MWMNVGAKWPAGVRVMQRVDASASTRQRLVACQTHLDYEIVPPKRAQTHYCWSIEYFGDLSVAAS